LDVLLFALVVCLTAVAMTTAASPAQATTSFASQTGKDCSFCHTTPGGPLTDEGQAFEDAGQKSPDHSEGAGEPTSSGPILPLSHWARVILVWLHVLGVIAWLAGAHVNTPRADRLSWPSLLVAGVTGVFLTLGDVVDAPTLAETRWGVLLLIKIVLFVILLAVTAATAFYISPRMTRLAESDPRRTRSQEQFKAQGRITVVHRGEVYDVTGSRLWPEGRHARRHDAWQDLTGALSGAPHGPEVLERFTVVEDAEESRLPLLMRMYSVLRYLSFALFLAILLLVVFW